jgi:hypothetical protein
MMIIVIIISRPCYNTDRYWTEKLTNGILAKTIPIVVGVRAPNETLLHKYINMDRIIYCQMPAEKYTQAPRFDDSDPEKRIKYVKAELSTELKGAKVRPLVVDGIECEEGGCVSCAVMQC